MERLKGKLTFANVVACLALFVALGGVGYAATNLPANSVGAKQIREGAVTPAKLSKATLARIGGGPAAPVGIPGPTGADGRQGERGPTGERGERGPAGEVANLTGLENRLHALEAENAALSSTVDELTTTLAGVNAKGRRWSSKG